MQKFYQNLYKYRIFRRLIPSLIRRLPNKESHNVHFRNFTINLNLESSIDREIYLKGFYDTQQINFIENKINLHEFDYFIDIGSNIGFYSIYLASKYKNLNIMSFEPIKENYDQINRSISINNYQKFNTYNYALSNTEENKTMWVTDLRKKGGFSIYEEEDYKKEISNNMYDESKLSKTEVETKIFDKNFEISEKKLLVKIDVERHELFCLLGMKKLLEENNNKTLIQIEITNQNKDKVFKILENYGFKLIHTISPDEKNQNYGLDYYFTNFT
tara:strand:+ start:66 stop:884 length:819 start_codon:yes stop_codon:yes gene_type:complete